MSTTALIRPLGRACPGTSLRGRLTYLPHRGCIVVPECFTGHGWHCGVVARASTRTDLHVTATIEELTTVGRTEIAVDPINLPELYAMAWQADVFARWPYTPIANLARCLGEQLLVPGARVVPTHAAAVRRLASATHLLPIVVTRLVDRLREAGYLTADRALGQDLALALPPRDGGGGTPQATSEVPSAP